MKLSNMLYCAAVAAMVILILFNIPRALDVEREMEAEKQAQIWREYEEKGN